MATLFQSPYYPNQLTPSSLDTYLVMSFLSGVWFILAIVPRRPFALHTNLPRLISYY